jgi:hypothetical protein
MALGLKDEIAAGSPWPGGRNPAYGGLLPFSEKPSISS